MVFCGCQQPECSMGRWWVSFILLPRVLWSSVCFHDAPTPPFSTTQGKSWTKVNQKKKQLFTRSRMVTEFEGPWAWLTDWMFIAFKHFCMLSDNEIMYLTSLTTVLITAIAKDRLLCKVKMRTWAQASLTPESVNFLLLPCISSKYFKALNYFAS